MKTYLALCLSAACALMMPSSQADAKSTAPSIRILPMIFPMTEIQPEDLAMYRKVGPWFAVYPHQMLPTQPVFKKSMSLDPADADNLMVHSGQKREPLFLLAGLKPLSEPVTVFFARDGMTIPEDGVALSAPNPSDDGYVTLRAQPPPPQAKNVSPDQEAKVEIILDRRDGASEKTQSLSPNNTSFYTFELIWAGDLDGDQKLDFFIKAQTEAGSSTYELWLSSRAEPNTLVKKVAEFETLGC